MVVAVERTFHRAVVVLVVLLTGRRFWRKLNKERGLLRRSSPSSDTYDSENQDLRETDVIHRDSSLFRQNQGNLPVTLGAESRTNGEAAKLVKN